MVDISLIIELSKHDQQLINNIDEFFQAKLPFLQGHYFESKVQDIGLHVTLYEFATYETHETLAEGIMQFTELEKLLMKRRVVPNMPRLSLVGCEVFPSSIVLYADLPTGFIDVVRETCQNLLPMSRYLNRLCIPFPLHCTAIRFSRELNAEEQHQLRVFANPYRKQVFGEFNVEMVSLLLTRKQPYQDVERRLDLKLAS
jgi:hypothetical protein